ncbi:MAG TPA: hypothetical protein VLQ90_09475, partial [Pyrinomonadaceae bacterium]|nr:hypothetical protein [Pyrinomonadaceae bacterium]
MKPDPLATRELRNNLNPVTQSAMRKPRNAKTSMGASTLVMWSAGFICLVLVVVSPLVTSSASSKHSRRTNAATPGNVTARARAIFSTNTTETFTLTAQVFTGTPDCTSGGGSATTINNLGQAGYTLALGPADSVLFTSTHLSDQSNETSISDSSGRFIDWLIPTGQAPGGLTVPPGTDGTQICVQGVDSPDVR